jgi:hypothetical protein
MDNLSVATWCQDLVTGLETVSGGTDSLRLYLGVTGSTLVGYIT